MSLSLQVGYKAIHLLKGDLASKSYRELKVWTKRMRFKIQREEYRKKEVWRQKTTQQRLKVLQKSTQEATK